MTVDCPYCNEEVEIDDSNLEYLNKEFDVYVEFEPVGSAEEIEYRKCDCCKREDKIRNFYKRGRTFPFPKDKKFEVLCHNCYGKQISLEWEQEKEQSK